MSGFSKIKPVILQILLICVLPCSFYFFVIVIKKLVIHKVSSFKVLRCRRSRKFLITTKIFTRIILIACLPLGPFAPSLWLAVSVISSSQVLCLSVTACLINWRSRADCCPLQRSGVRYTGYACCSFGGNPFWWPPC